MNRDMLSRRLEKRGHTITTAVDGAAGVARAKAEAPDIILMDLIMPGIDGAEATRQIMQESPCVVLVVTATTVGNRDLVSNMINWLSSDEDLISIRPKETEDRPLNVSTQKLNAIFWLSILIFPGAVVAFGLATWWKRR